MKSFTAWLIRRALPVAAATALGVSLVAIPQAASAVEKSGLNVGHLNIKWDLSREAFLADLNLITSRAGMVGLNEVREKRAVLENWAERNGWHLYAPDPAAASSEALLAKKSVYSVISRNSTFVCDINPGELPVPKYLNWVRYQHKASGRSIYHINLHAVSGIDNAGHPRDLPRTKCAEKHFRMVRDLAADKSRYGQVVVTGDLNVDYVNDRQVRYQNFPFVVLDERDRADAIPGLRSSYSLHGVKGTGTHGTRHIDYAYFWKRQPERRRLWMIDYAIVGGTNSDHNGIVAKFSIQHL
ncbi:MAG: hypothetical protein ACRDTU_10330 [Micromonosporaceae bacterium]